MKQILRFLVLALCAIASPTQAMLIQKKPIAPIREIPLELTCWDFSWNHDSSTLAISAGDQSPTRNFLKLYDVETGKETTTLENAHLPFNQVKFSPSSNALLAAINHTTKQAHIWDTKSGKLIKTIQALVEGYGGDISWNPQGTLLAFNCKFEKKISIYNLDGQLQFWVPVELSQSNWNNQNTIFVKASFGENLYKINPETQNCEPIFLANGLYLPNSSPTGNKLAFSYLSSNQFYLTIVDTTEFSQKKYNVPGAKFSWSHDEQYLASTYTNDIHMINPTSGELWQIQATQNRRFYDCHWSPNTYLLAAASSNTASADNRVVIYNMDNLKKSN